MRNSTSFSVINGPTAKPISENGSSVNESADGGFSNEAASFFHKYATCGTPFDFQTEEDEGEDVLEVSGVCHVTTTMTFEQLH